MGGGGNWPLKYQRPSARSKKSGDHGLGVTARGDRSLQLLTAPHGSILSLFMTKPYTASAYAGWLCPNISIPRY